jgi:hypothetical protein
MRTQVILTMFNSHSQPAADAYVGPGTEVEVLGRYESRWVCGFEVADVDETGQYQLRRRSDGAVLPVPFARHTVRARDTNRAAKIARELRPELSEAATAIRANDPAPFGTVSGR